VFHVGLTNPAAGEVAVDKAAPVFGYTLAIADTNQVFVRFSEPVEKSGGGLLTAADFAYSGAGTVTTFNRVSPTTGTVTEEALLTLSANVSATEAVTPAAIGVGALQDAAATPNAFGANTHRVTDLGLGLNVGPEYGIVEPAFAKDQTIRAPTPGVGYINVFDGTKWLRRQDITIEGRLHTLAAPFGPGVYPAVQLWYDVGVASTYTTASGLWLPAFPGTDFNGLVPGPDPGALAASAKKVVDDQHVDFTITQATAAKIVDGATVQFLFQVLAGTNVAKDLFVARVPDASASDWYRTITPWSFQIHDIIVQRGGAQILNNQINPDKGEITTLQYTTASGGQVTVTVFDLAGNIVSVLVRANQAAGDYAVAWDGTNRAGRKVARGIYFVRIVAPGMDETRKVLVIR
jgi:hypothetical protein